MKLCSIDVGRHLCSGLSFNPTNWRQLCTVSSDVLSLWNIGQLNTKYTLVSRSVFCQITFIMLAFWFVFKGFTNKVLVGRIHFCVGYLWYRLLISHVLNEQGTGYEHIFSSVQTFNID